MLNKIRSLKDKFIIKYQRSKRGFSYIDAYNINSWMSHQFAGMILYLRDNTITCPIELKHSVNDFPTDWVKANIPIVEKVLRDNGDPGWKFNSENSFHMWLLILTRMAYCFNYTDSNKYVNNINVGDESFLQDCKQAVDLMNKYKTEAMKLLNIYFYDMWS